MRLYMRTWITALSLFVVSCAAGLWVLHQTHRWPRGDGPHYAIMASSLVSHGSFDVKPSYTSGDYIGVFFYAPLDFHINPQYFAPDSAAWYTYHSFGLPLILSPFLVIGQQLHIPALYALQLGMVVLQALGVVVVYLYVLELIHHNAAALVAAITLLGSMAYLGLAGRLYPDLLTAAVLAGSLLCLARLRRKPQSLLSIAVLSALAGFGPYLHVKTCLMSLTLLLLGLVHWWRNGRSKRMLACLLVPAAMLMGIYAVKIHSWYHTWVITAPFGNGLLFHFAPGPSILANLFDTSRGILPNNPAFLLILLGLPILWKRDRSTALVTLAVLLPSLLLQSTFADWAGGCSPIGGRYLLPYVVCALPAIAFLYVELRWLFRSLMILPMLAGLAIGVYNIRMDYECSYAGDSNAGLVSLLETYHVRADFATPIFSHDLILNGDDAAIQLLVGIGVALTIFLTGFVAAQQRPVADLVGCESGIRAMTSKERQRERVRGSDGIVH
jgi:hypothetical protein